ncbi:MAG: phage major capsid protein, partial [Proteobacteria bacterium]|nr:phage major capsid protein [Pseudomonadota bacterium]
MPDTNKDILEKTDMVLSDLQSGGSLPEEKADKFIRMLSDQPTILGSCRVQPMKTSTMEISKMGFGERIMRAPNATGGIAEGDRSAPSLGKITLAAKKAILGVRIPFDVLDLNIEREGFEQSLMEEIAKRASLDLEELIVTGDTTSGDAFLALFDGLVKLGGVRKDFDGAEFGDVSVTGYLMSAMAAKYQSDIKAMRFYASFATR